MAITPNTELRLIKCPLNLDNKNQITFDDQEDQAEYFQSLDYIEIGDSDISYQRKDGIIRVDRHIDSIIEYNYCMYKNKNYSNKWFYAFIVGMEYINDHRTDVKIITDVFQTWQFDITWKASFVEREMLSVSDDVPGANLLPENFEIGEPIINATASIDDLKPYVIVAYSGPDFPIDPSDPDSVNIANYGTKLNGIPGGVGYNLVRLVDLPKLISDINGESHGDGIISVFTVPKLAVKTLANYIENNPGYAPYPIAVSIIEAPTEKVLNSRPSSIDGYTPRNKKLLQYPFLYLGFNPQNGSEKIYRYENFLNATPKFKFYSEVNPNPLVEVIPENYRGDGTTSINDASVISGYPSLSYANDVYNSWLAKNSEVINLQMQQAMFNYEIGAYQSGGKMIGSMLGIVSDTENMGSHFSNTVNEGIDLFKTSINTEYDIAQKMAQMEAQKLLPDQVNMSSSNATLLGYELLNENVFTRYSIKSEFAKRIDSYFDMYGYLTNKVKIPNTNNRTYWNYVKTVGANILGDIPQTDLQAIKTMFNQGVTLWHDTTYFLDYTQNNRS